MYNSDKVMVRASSSSSSGYDVIIRCHSYLAISVVSLDMQLILYVAVWRELKLCFRVESPHMQ